MKASDRPQSSIASVFHLSDFHPLQPFAIYHLLSSLPGRLPRLACQSGTPTSSQLHCGPPTPARQHHRRPSWRSRGCRARLMGHPESLVVFVLSLVAQSGVNVNLGRMTLRSPHSSPPGRALRATNLLRRSTVLRTAVQTAPTVIYK